MNIFTPEEQRRIDELLKKAARHPAQGEFPPSPTGIFARVVFQFNEALTDDDVKLMTRYMAVTYPEKDRYLITEASNPKLCECAQCLAARRNAARVRNPPCAHCGAVSPEHSSTEIMLYDVATPAGVKKLCSSCRETARLVGIADDIIAAANASLKPCDWMRSDVDISFGFNNGTPSVGVWFAFLGRVRPDFATVHARGPTVDAALLALLAKVRGEPSSAGVVDGKLEPICDKNFELVELIERCIFALEQMDLTFDGHELVKDLRDAAKKCHR